MNKGRRFLVVETCEDYEQTLRLDTAKGLPPGGVLRWRDDRPATAFGTRQAARAGSTEQPS